MGGSHAADRDDEMVQSSAPRSRKAALLRRDDIAMESEQQVLEALQPWQAEHSRDELLKLLPSRKDSSMHVGQRRRVQVVGALQLYDPHVPQMSSMR